ncbi:MAG: hypothetical protein EZS28_010277 [Streblomastix strix]|uniref:Uncharacterized protein n=1 Tax=Streblomastix strix TaxID=222440 RepID=A0A5J4WHA0_9EUKA|nr:MAG: hypothetical protein EZS28_010277 [Streblomastix strix]
MLEQKEIIKQLQGEELANMLVQLESAAENVQIVAAETISNLLLMKKLSTVILINNRILVILSKVVMKTKSLQLKEKCAEILYHINLRECQPQQITDSSLTINPILQMASV